MTRRLSESVEAPQAARRQSEHRYQSLVESITDYAIVFLDLTGRVVTWSAGAEHITGYTAADVLGQHFSRFFTPEAVSADEPRRALEHALAEGRYETEALRVKQDGSKFWASVVLNPVRDETGELIGFVEVTRDASKRRAAELALQQRADEATQELDSFSYSVSHDLRAPLRAIDGFSKILLESAAAKLNDDEQAHLDRIRSAAQRMSQLIDDLLSLSRLTRAPFSTVLIDVSASAARIVGKLRQREPSRQIETVIEPNLETQADPVLLAILLEKLLENAWKFTRHRDDARIEVGSIRSDGRVQYFVSDNGVGFDQKYAGKLFMPFQRLHRIREFEGTGIGLAIARRIVQRHGGHIWHESQPNAGATFLFTLASDDTPPEAVRR